MRLLFEIGHPGHVHLFKYAIREMEGRGHSVRIVAREKEGITRYLLDKYGFKYELLHPNIRGLSKKAITMMRNDWRMLEIARKFDPDLFISPTSPHSGHVSTIMDRPHVCMGDTETAGLQLMITMPFLDCILTPREFRKDLGAKHLRYDGFHELAYLHPNRYEPDPSVLNDIGLDTDGKFAVIRFVSWSAHHDVGKTGTSLKDKIKLIDAVEKNATPIITSEGRLPRQLEKYRIRVPPEKIHDLLYYSDLYVGEGATLAVESAILGTPAIFFSPFVGALGNLNVLENRYRLLFSYNAIDKVRGKVVNILSDDKSKSRWAIKREALIKDKMDVTSFMVEFIEGWPESYHRYRKMENESK